MARKNKSTINTYVRNGVELGNLANFPGDESKLLEVYLKIQISMTEFFSRRQRLKLLYDGSIYEIVILNASKVKKTQIAQGQVEYLRHGFGFSGNCCFPASVLVWNTNIWYQTRQSRQIKRADISKLKFQAFSLRQLVCYQILELAGKTAIKCTFFSTKRVYNDVKRKAMISPNENNRAISSPLAFLLTQA